MQNTILFISVTSSFQFSMMKIVKQNVASISPTPMKRTRGTINHTMVVPFGLCLWFESQFSIDYARCILI